MALKIKTTSGMKTIDTNLNKPVTFIGGNKYVLDKAWVFVNGVKNIIWGGNGIRIDYISSTGSLGGGNIFAIGENWVDCTHNKQVYRIDISNLSNPTLIQNVQWGSVVYYNGYQTVSGNMVFYNLEANPYYTISSNKMQLNPVSGAITIGRNKTDSQGVLEYYVNDTDNNLVTSIHRTKTFGLTPVYYGENFYWNGVLKYSTGREPSSVGDTSGRLVLNGHALQVGQDEIIFNLVGNYGSGTGLYRGTDSGYNSITNARNGNLMYDDDVITREYYDGSAVFVGGTGPKTALSLLDKTYYAETHSFDTDFDNTGKILKFLGRVGDYYYVITMPNDINATNGVKIIALNKADLSVAVTRDLPADPFGENNGTVAYWHNCSTVPQVSQTGFVGVSTYNANTLGLRIVRFSAIF